MNPPADSSHFNLKSQNSSPPSPPSHQLRCPSISRDVLFLAVTTNVFRQRSPSPLPEDKLTSTLPQSITYLELIYLAHPHRRIHHSPSDRPSTTSTDSITLLRLLMLERTLRINFVSHVLDFISIFKQKFPSSWTSAVANCCHSAAAYSIDLSLSWLVLRVFESSSSHLKGLVRAKGPTPSLNTLNT